MGLVHCTLTVKVQYYSILHVQRGKCVYHHAEIHYFSYFHLVGKWWELVSCL